MYDELTTDPIETDVGFIDETDPVSDSTESILDTIPDIVTDAVDSETVTESRPIILVEAVPPVNGVPRFLDFVSATFDLEVILCGVAIAVGAFLIGVIFDLMGGDRR